MQPVKVRPNKAFNSGQPIPKPVKLAEAFPSGKDFSDAIKAIVKERDNAHSFASGVNTPGRTDEARAGAIHNAHVAATNAARKKLAEYGTQIKSELSKNIEHINKLRYPEASGGQEGRLLSAIETQNANTMIYPGDFPTAEIRQAVAERRMSLAAGLVQRGRATRLDASGATIEQALRSNTEQQEFEKAVSAYEEATGIAPILQVNSSLEKAAQIVGSADTYLKQEGVDKGAALIAFGIAAQD